MLTFTVVLGVVTSTRWVGQSLPAFITADLHRNLSLLALALLGAHVITTVLDPFAHITVRDVLIPVGAAYRPLWLGIGVVAAEVMVAVIVTSLLRDRIGARLWRAIHWLAYGSWPLAVIHGLGTGSDARSPWLIGVVVSCVVAVTLAVAQRVREGEPATLPIRAAGGAAASLTILLSSAWAFTGPFQGDWSFRAGTPQPVAATTARTGPVHTGPGGFSDPLVGVVVRDSSGNYQIAMRDTADPGLTISIRSPGPSETLPVVSIARDGRALCTVPASVTSTLYAVCGTTRVVITFFGDGSVVKSGGNITGRIDTSGPLN